jgi:hypothetical protein
VDANKAITATREHLKRHAKTTEAGADEDSDSDDDASRSITGDSLDEETTPPVQTEVKGPVTGQRGPLERTTTVVEDVIGKKGVYGRFADKWFSKGGWSAEGRRMQGMSSEEDLSRKMAQTPPNVESTLSKEEDRTKGPKKPEQAPETIKEEIEAPGSPEDIPKAFAQPVDNTTLELLPKILRTTKLYFSSRSFFFSYDYDISRSLGKQQGSSSGLPLFKQFDPIVSPILYVLKHALTYDLVLLESPYIEPDYRRRPAYLCPPTNTGIRGSESFHGRHFGGCFTEYCG